MKTIRLDTTIVTPQWATARRARWYDLPTPAAAAIVMACLLAIGLLAGRIKSEPAVVAEPTPALPVIVIKREPAPPARVAAPVQPTPDPALYAELAALRARVAELEQQQAAPQVIMQPVYVEQPAQIELAAPTPEPEPYTVASDPAGDFYTTPPVVDPAFQQSLVGDDPNALACGGSPLCGGMTNAEAQAALNAQR